MARTMRRRRNFKGKRLNKTQKKEVKTIISRRQELKYWLPAQVNNVAANNSAAFSDLSLITQGTTDQQRIGDALEWCGKAEFVYQLVGAESASALIPNDVYNTFRVMIFQYHPSAVAGTTPIVGNILLTGPTGGVDVYSQYNHDHRQDYTILYDKVFNVVNNYTLTVAGNTTYQSNHVRLLKFKLDTKRWRKHLQYVGAGTNGTNKIYEMVLTDSSAVPDPTFSRSCKLFFRDS